MQVLVCLKVVSDPGQEVILSELSDRVLVQERKISSYDLQALELALRLREKSSDVRVDVLSVGGDGALWGLRRALGLGADRAIRIAAELPALGHSLGVAALIADCPELGDYDLILCGFMSEDNMQGVVPGALAGYLNWSCLSYVTDLVLDGPLFRVLREDGSGSKTEIIVPRPAVLGVQSGPLRPRYPRLSLLLKAKQAEILDVKPSCRVQDFSFSLEYARPVRKGRLVAKDRSANLDAFVGFLREKGLLVP